MLSWTKEFSGHVEVCWSEDLDGDSVKFGRKKRSKWRLEEFHTIPMIRDGFVVVEIVNNPNQV